MRVLIAPDKFKGTLTAAEAADAMAAAVADVFGAGTVVIEQLPIADGGDGTVAVLGGANQTSTVTDPLGRTARALWRLDDRTAIIESAAASGLVLVGGAAENDPWAASTIGTGELIREAVELGATKILVGMGGVATTDGGRGALAALTSDVPFADGTVEVLVDTSTPFLQAAEVFGPQKGADSELIERLTRRLSADAVEWLDRFGIDVRDVPGSGAAGGLAGALYAAGATIRDGVEVVADYLRLWEVLREVDLVITGEGAFDHTSINGKGPGCVLAEARKHGIPTLVVAGSIATDAGHIASAHASIVEIVGQAAAFETPSRALRVATAHALDQYINGRESTPEHR
ncbi:glycerate kinase (plasmid) [Mycobacterium sp. C3-094]